MQQAVQALLKQQRQAWPMFARGEQALQYVQRREIVSDQGHVVVQANPQRKVSSAAKLDPKSIAARPCFLCENNLPAEERGLLFDQRWFVVANPFPIVPGHLSIPSLTHQPQKLSEQVDAMLALAQALPEYAIFYNGPRCGASAPDHLHFQACLRKDVPSLAQVNFSAIFSHISSYQDQVQQHVLRWPSRRALVLFSRRQDKLAQALQHSLDKLRELSGQAQEPMVNVFALQLQQAQVLVVFPRTLHRPACFYAEAQEQILVSPGALDMAGLMVVAELDHFARLDDKMVCDIYAQVSLDDARFSQWIKELS